MASRRRSSSSPRPRATRAESTPSPPGARWARTRALGCHSSGSRARTAEVAGAESSAGERWRARIRARAAQMDATYARRGRTSADFGDRRAKGFHRAPRDGTRDPFYALVARHAGPRTTVLDVGAGTGRFSLALAPLA